MSSSDVSVSSTVSWRIPAMMVSLSIPQSIKIIATQFINENEVAKVFILTSDSTNVSEKTAESIGYIQVGNILSTETMLKMAQNATADYVLFYMKTSPITLGYHALTRLVRVAADTKAALVYADHYSVEAGKVVRHPVIDYQAGSLRDDFDFGSLVFVIGLAKPSCALLTYYF